MKKGNIVRVDIGVSDVRKKKAKEFGTGAHITVPLKWLGRTVIAILSEDTSKGKP